MSSSVVGSDILSKVLIFTFLVGSAVLLWLDQKLYPGHFLEHLPDHLLALIAIAAGISAIYYERKLDKGFEAQRAEIKKIVDSVLTRSIGNWPDHVSDIAALVKDTRPGEELLIFVDFLGYAHFSRHDSFMEYLNQLQNARRNGVAVKILLHSEHGLRNNLDEQFSSEKKASEALQKTAQEYQAMYKNLIAKPKLETYDEFATAILYVQARFCDSLLDATASPPAEIAAKKDTQPETVFYWLVRQGENLRTMIFAYSRFSGVGQGYGFKTADSTLMAIFSRDFDRKWTEAEVISRGSKLVPVAWEAADGWRQAREGSAKSAATGGPPGA